MFRAAAAQGAAPLPEEFARLPLVAELYDKLHAMTGLALARQPGSRGPARGRATPGTKTPKERRLAVVASR
jgi:hypothetical protein